MANYKDIGEPKQLLVQLCESYLGTILDICAGGRGDWNRISRVGYARVHIHMAILEYLGIKRTDRDEIDEVMHNLFRYGIDVPGDLK